MAALQLRAGMVVGRGRFRLVRPLGRGGLGEVWMAEDLQLSQAGDDVVVALKFLKAQIRSDARRLSEFRREVLRSRELAHPNLVRIFDWHETEGEPVFYSMEYVEGLTLQQLQSAQPERRLGWAQVRPLVLQLGEALHYAHTSHGLVHSDLKPANVMVDDHGRVKLGDFGMARRVAMVDGQWMAEVRRGGTRAYMSPQQFRGDPALLSDDLYSLGATLFHLLTGALPIPDGAAFVMRLETAVPPAVTEQLAAQGMVSDIPPSVVQVIRQCLEKHPEERPGSVREVLRRLGATGSVSNPPVSLPPVPEVSAEAVERSRPASRSPRWVRELMEWLAFGVVLVGLVWGGLQLWDKVNPPEPRRPDLLTTGTGENGEKGEKTDDKDLSQNKLGGEDSGERESGAKGGDATRPNPPDGFLKLVFKSPPQKGTIQWRIVSPEGRIETHSVSHSLEPTVVSVPPGDWVVQMGVGDPSAYTWLSRSVQAIRGTTNPVVADWSPGSHTIIVPRVPDLEVQLIDPFRRDSPIVVFKKGSQMGGRLPIGGIERGSVTGPKLASGPVTYRITAPHYRPLETNVYVLAGDLEQALIVDLEPSPAPMQGQVYTNTFLELRFHPVAGARGFWAAETETTVAQYSQWPNAPVGEVRVTTSTGLKVVGRSWSNAVPDQTLSHPVVGVSWTDAMAFAAWLTERERQKGNLEKNQKYTLPTADQWSLLAGSRRYPWGNDSSPKGSENLAGDEARHGDWPAQWTVFLPVDHQDPFPRTSPVRSFQTNGFGLFDVGGNVSEWCLDAYKPELNPESALREDPDLNVVPSGESWRVVCGGNWSDDHPPDLLRDLRRRRAETERNDWTGFRLVIVEEGGITP